MAESDVATASSSVQVADAVFARLREIVAADAGDDRFLRVSVLGGGCSGFQYKFELAGAPEADDLVFDGGDVGVLVDSVSAPFLENAVIDYKQELIGARFAVENPNASSTCGCGVSFSV